MSLYSSGQNIVLPPTSLYMSYFILNVFSYMQQFTLYDRNLKKTIVIIMRDFKIIPDVMGILYKDHMKEPKRGNMCLTNRYTDGTIVGK